MISGNNEVSFCRECSTDYDIVIWIGCDALGWHRPYQCDQFGIAIHELIDGELRGSDFILELAAPEYASEFSKQGYAGKKLDPLFTLGLQ